MKTERRSVIKKMFASVVGLTGLGIAANAKANPNLEKEANNITTFQDVPLFSGHTKFGNMVFRWQMITLWEPVRTVSKILHDFICPMKFLHSSRMPHMVFVLLITRIFKFS